MRPLAIFTLVLGLLAGLSATAHAAERYRTDLAPAVGGGHVRYGYDRTLGHHVPRAHSTHRVQRHHVRPRVRHVRPAHRVTRSHHVQPHRVHRDPYADRTKFCRKERAIEARTGRKVRVKRCIYVRNDLLGNYAGGGWSRH